MFKGKELVDKLIKLDGLRLEDIMLECGYEDNFGYLMPERFYSAISRYAESYVEAVSKLRKQQLLHGESAVGSMDLLLQRLVGSALLERIYELDECFINGPPWEEKRKIVIKCGYVSLTPEAEINVEYSEFEDKLDEAQTIADMRNIEDSLADSEQNALKYNDTLIRVAVSESQDEIDLAARRLIDLAECIGAAWIACALKAIRIEYSGCGDDGEIASIEYFLSDLACDGQSDASSPASVNPPDNVVYGLESLNREQYERCIKDDAFSISYNCHGSWFNESGGDGFLLIDIASSTIYGHHFQNEDPNGFPGKRASFLSPYFIAVRDV